MKTSQKLHVVAGLDVDDRAALKAARERARPVHRAYQAAVAAAVRGRTLPRVATDIAKELCNYPSANFGWCYPGQTRVGKKIGVSGRTVRRAMRLMRAAGFLDVKQRGPGLTASWFLCIDGRPILAASRPANDVQDRPKMAAADRPKMAGNPFLSDPFEHKPPYMPQADAEGVATTTPDAVVLDGVVLGPEGEVTFKDFWEAITHDAGKIGPAQAAWTKLSDAERRQVGNLIGPNRTIDLDGTYAGVWLKNRMWQSGIKTRTQKWCEAAEQLREFVDRQPDAVVLSPYSAQWEAERASRIAKGLPVSLMDEWAKAGRGWSVSRP